MRLMFDCNRDGDRGRICKMLEIVIIKLAFGICRNEIMNAVFLFNCDTGED